MAASITITMPELTEIRKTSPPAAEAADDADAGSGSDSDASEVI